MDKKSYSLLELNTFIKRILALNFDQEVWVKAEILSLSIKKGHYYLTLIQKEGSSDDIIAQISATIWSTDIQKIKKINPDLDSYFIAGHEVLFSGVPVFHEKFGLQFKITGIDAAFTRGALDQKKEELFARIKQERLDELNKELYCPPAFINIAILSSSNAAGYIDFTNHINNNSYNLKFKLHLFDSVMQGINLEAEMLQNMDQIASLSNDFDALIIIRGGGSKVDLAGFDNYNIAYKAATFPIPVFTGIGHDIDISSLDLVAYKSFKTPTAVAEYFIESNLKFLSEIQNTFQNILDEASINWTRKNYELKTLSVEIANMSKTRILNFKHFIDQYPGKILHSAKLRLNKAQYLLESIIEKIRIQNPLEVLKKGYVIVVQNNKKINTLQEFNLSAHAELNFTDGIIKVKATTTNGKEK